MTSVRFDHFITYVSAASVEDHLTAYAAQGFLPSERTVRHDPGLRNGFVFIGPEYLEFCWVEDEALFAAADAEEKLLRSMLRPFGLGIVADDVQAVQDKWVTVSPSPSSSKTPRCGFGNVSAERVKGSTWRRSRNELPEDWSRSGPECRARATRHCLAAGSAGRVIVAHSCARRPRHMATA